MDVKEIASKLADIITPIIVDNISNDPSLFNNALLEDSYDDVLSDIRLKNVINRLDDNGQYVDTEDVKFLLDKLDSDYDSSEDTWDDSVLDGYADNIRNYAYNYKNEAKAIDPGINPNELEIGPMAQDIEQVNPACIDETPEGIKTVNTKKLSMMNAGAIADLARDIREIKEMLHANNR